MPEPRAHDLADLPALLGSEQVLPDGVAVAVAAMSASTIALPTEVPLVGVHL